MRTPPREVPLAILDADPQTDVEVGPPEGATDFAWHGNRFATDPQYDAGSEHEALVDTAVFAEAGKVKRHIWRGSAPEDARETRRREDASSWCGNRNPSGLQESWPDLCRVMTGVAEVLIAGRARDQQLQHLTRTFGDSPEQEPPTEEAIRVLRASVARHVGITPMAAEKCHPNSP